MALFDYARPVSTVDRVRYSVTNIVALIAAWNDQRRTRNELNKLSNDLLDDLGLSRADIDRIAGSGRLF